MSMARHNLESYNAMLQGLQPALNEVAEQKNIHVQRVSFARCCSSLEAG